MKHLLPLILFCLLLCGCGRNDFPEDISPTLPVESATGAPSEPEEFGGAVQSIPLNLRKVHGLRTSGELLFLFSGYGSTTLTVLDSRTMEEIASLALDFQLESNDPSLRFHPDGSISFFSSGSAETIVLDPFLNELYRLESPGALKGVPILSDDRTTLYYCTASHLRAWDLESGIRRYIKEMNFDSQLLINVLMDGTVLQCLVTDGEKEKSLFVSSKNGLLLHSGDGMYSLITEGSGYYAAFPAGHNNVLVYGQTNAPGQMLYPAEPYSEAFFLPGMKGLLTAESLQDNQAQLTWYDLDSGHRTHVLTLDRFHYPSDAQCTSDGLYLLTYDPTEDQNLLYRWDVKNSDSLAVKDSVRYTSRYYSADSPDMVGLSQCHRMAEQLEERYGIQILIGDEAAKAAPWDYTFTPEYLVPFIQRELDLLQQRLAVYPEEILHQTASHFTSLNLCLVRSIVSTSGRHMLNGSTGIQYLDGTDAYVVITTGKFSHQALYHELFHVMETHIFGESIAFDRWNELNPAGFQYDYNYTANAVRDSGVYLFQESRAFVDTYSMSFPKEDRARIMEYAMLPNQEDLFLPQAMQKKLKTLCSGIRDAYDLKEYKGVFLWEQYLDQ